LDGTSRLLTTVLATAHEHYVLIDRDKRYRFASASALDALQLSTAQVIGQTWRELGLPAKLMEPIEARWDRVLRTGQSIRDEIDYPTAGGLRTFAYQLDAVRDSGGNIAGLLTGARDVTEQRQVEKALWESEDRYRRAVTTAAVPIMLHADDGDVLAVSEGLLAATGYTRDQLRRFEDWLVLPRLSRAGG
jgi:PAS domain S-box-containing protein